MGANWPGYLQPERLAGWLPSGGYGVNGYSPTTFFVEPFLDNGINSDQDNAFFVQNAGNLKQTVTGLTAGQPYTLVFDYNFRDGRGLNSSGAPNLGQLELTLDGAVVLTTDELPPVDSVSPWPGFWHTKPFYQAFVPFTAQGDTAEVIFAHVGVTADETMLLDNVRILPGARTPPAITTELAEQTIQAGATATFNVTASGNNLTYRWLQDGVPLVDGGSISGATTGTLTVASAQLTHSGTYTVLVTDGVGVVGSAAALTVEAPVADDTVTVGLAAGKVVIAWPTAAAGYRVQRAPALPALPADWTDEATPAVQNGANWEVQVDPTGTQGFYRLTQ